MDNEGFSNMNYATIKSNLSIDEVCLATAQYR